ncbi:MULTISPECIES: hypothetical protein [Hymenobacter]|uniref:Uncharacterized protein n=1 Tax=Hymenobacter glacieicola TaxID=1562124 RepID=A0ABQ1X6S7_9BACT|nr:MULTISPECIES: hypothetical protein [Hymenobacter]RPD43540.1 hypothetical protein DNI29_23595 [Hymenobacter sediminis]GGG62532.1 hypothetical protein GCM10011378_43370 [Hymenobacter glacieicola]
MSEKKLYSIRFYADGPDGKTDNKLFNYSVYQGGHAADLLLRFLRKGFRIKSVYLIHPYETAQLGDRVPPTWIEVLSWGEQKQAHSIRQQMEYRWPELDEDE